MVNLQYSGSLGSHYILYYICWNRTRDWEQSQYRTTSTERKMKFFNTDFLSNYDQIRSFFLIFLQKFPKLCVLFHITWFKTKFPQCYTLFFISNAFFQSLHRLELAPRVILYKLSVFGFSGWVFVFELSGSGFESSDSLVKKSVLKNFMKFTEKHLCQGLFFNKAAGLRNATLFKNSFWYMCIPVNSAKFLRTPFLQNTSRCT